MKIKTIIVILVILVIGYFIFDLGTVESHIKRNVSKMGIDISKCENIRTEAPDASFHGDGEYVVVANCEKNNEIDFSYWKKLPLTENLQIAMYGGKIGDRTYHYEFAIDNGIPEIKNGYYYFIDRHSKATNIYSDENLLSRYSFNFTIAFYDLDTNLFYYYELNT